MNKLGFLSILIGSFLIGLVPPTIPDPDGWVPVERAETQKEEFPEEENGFWVVFSKEMEGEKFLVRFPDDPSYRYNLGGIQLDSFQDEDHMCLQVEKRLGGEIATYFDGRMEEIKSIPQAILLKAKQGEMGDRLDLFYRIDEKWVWERIVVTSKLLYTFRTESPAMTGEAHRKFIASFDINQK